MKIRINESFIKSNKLSRNYTLINLADLHLCSKVPQKLLDELIEIICFVKPDAILIPGDFMDTLDDLENKLFLNKLVEYLDKLQTIAPCFMSFDWHDYITINAAGKMVPNDELFYVFSAMLEDIGIKLFLPNYSQVETLNDEILISGYSFDSMPSFSYRESQKSLWIKELEKHIKMMNLTPNTFNALLYHKASVLFNDSRPINYLENIDFIVSGHEHGRMTPKILSKQGNTGWVTPEKDIASPYIGGTYTNEKLTINASRGLTKIPYTANKFLQLANYIYRPDLDICRIVK